MYAAPESFLEFTSNEFVFAYQWHMRFSDSRLSGARTLKPPSQPFTPSTTSFIRIKICIVQTVRWRSFVRKKKEVNLKVG